LENVKNSEIARTNEIKEFEAMVKAYAAETQRISAVQAGMTEEQIQDIVMGTIAAAMDTGDLVSNMPQMPPMQEPQMPMQQPEMQEMQQPQMGAQL